MLFPDKIVRFEPVSVIPPAPESTPERVTVPVPVPPKVTVLLSVRLLLIDPVKEEFWIIEGFVPVRLKEFPEIEKFVVIPDPKVIELT